MDIASERNLRYATIKIRNVAAIPTTLVELGTDPAKVLLSSGLGPNLFSSPENVILFAALSRLVRESVEATGCEDFGLRVGAKTNASALGLTSLVSFNCATVREALEVVIATLKTSDRGGRAFLKVAGDEASFGYAVVAPKIESDDQIVDGAAAVGFNLMRRLCGPTWRPVRVRLTRAAPPDPMPFSRFFDAPIAYAEPLGCLVFDLARLDQPVRDQNQTTRRSSRRCWICRSPTCAATSSRQSERSSAAGSAPAR